MDIRDWPLAQIMQLPDECFGRRWVVSCEKVGVLGEQQFEISEVAFPEVGVIWNVAVEWWQVISTARYYRLALGDRLPASSAELSGLEPLLMGLGVQGADPREISIYGPYGSVFWPMRMNVHFGGRRLVLGVLGGAAAITNVRVVVTVSSIPREAPDWLVSR